jgi:hypothetical protein
MTPQIQRDPADGSQVDPLALALMELDLLEARSRALMHALRTRGGDHHWALWRTDLRAVWRAWDRRFFSLPLDQAADPGAAAPTPAAIEAAPAADRRQGGRVERGYCQWCGGKPDDRRIVVSGPGVTICSDCIGFVSES